MFTGDRWGVVSINRPHHYHAVVFLPYSQTTVSDTQTWNYISIPSSFISFCTWGPFSFLFSLSRLVWKTTKLARNFLFKICAVQYYVLYCTQKCLSIGCSLAKRKESPVKVFALRRWELVRRRRATGNSTASCLPPSSELFDAQCMTNAAELASERHPPLSLFAGESFSSNRKEFHQHGCPVKPRKYKTIS